jgi:hypothetical protein
VFGLPEGRPAALFRGIAGGLGSLGTAGREMSAAFLFWLRGILGPGGDPPAAVAGVVAGDGPAGGFAAVSDPRGRLAGALLAEAVLRLAREREGRTGLLRLPEIIGSETARKLAASCRAEIAEGRTDPR